MDHWGDSFSVTNKAVTPNLISDNLSVISTKLPTQIELIAPPPIVLLMGLCGSGKSFIGEILQRYAGFYWYEADEDLTPAMLRAIKSGESFTESMRDEFFSIVLDRTQVLSLIYPHVVVTQATYKRRHQELFRAIPGLQIVWVRSAVETIMKRLGRTHGELTPEYAQTIECHFEQPSSETLILQNDHGVSEVIQQLVAMFN